MYLVLEQLIPGRFIVQEKNWPAFRTFHPPMYIGTVPVNRGHLVTIVSHANLGCTPTALLNAMKVHVREIVFHLIWRSILARALGLKKIYFVRDFCSACAT